MLEEGDDFRLCQSGTIIVYIAKKLGNYFANIVYILLYFLPVVDL
jgi:hypothetical protein